MRHILLGGITISVACGCENIKNRLTPPHSDEKKKKGSSRLQSIRSPISAP
jgi:hypothetical protein